MEMAETEEKDFVFIEVDGEGVLVDVEGGKTFFINETGLIIYKMLKNGKNEKEIEEKIMSEFDVRAEEARGDIKDFRGLLEGNGVL